MTQPTYVPDPANRWATEHYGFADDAGAATRRPGGTRGSLPTADRSARPRIKNRLAATIVGIALVSGAGGAAIASRASHVDTGTALAFVTGMHRHGDGGESGGHR